MKELLKREKGFTIIEVVIVLAIAGLIFGVVFLAVPGFQRNQRDTQRHNDVGRFIAEAKNSSTNNHQKLPGDGGGTVANFVQNYLNKGASAGFADPFTHNDYTVTVFGGSESGHQSGSPKTPENMGDVYYGINYHCGDSGSIEANSIGNNSPDDASFAVSIKTENGDAYCQAG